MTARNTDQSFGTIIRAFHWLTALLILTAFPLGLYASNLAHDTAEALAWKAQVFSVHKTIGVSAFLLGLARILWAIFERHPVPLHPARRAEVTLAGAVHWLLYLSLVVVPLSGWVHHAAVTGFAPILWPFGQTLPFVPQSETVAGVARTAHWVFTKVLVGSILLHIAGALKHHLLDRDATLLRMLRGAAAPVRPQARSTSRAPLVIALAIYVAGAGLVLQLLPRGEAQAAAITPAADTGNWAVTEGNLSFTV